MDLENYYRENPGIARRVLAVSDAAIEDFLEANIPAAVKARVENAAQLNRPLRPEIEQRLKEALERGVSDLDLLAEECRDLLPPAEEMAKRYLLGLIQIRIEAHYARQALGESLSAA